MSDYEKRLLFVMWASIIVVCITLDMRIHKLEKATEPKEVKTDGE